MSEARGSERSDPGIAALRLGDDLAVEVAHPVGMPDVLGDRGRLLYAAGVLTPADLHVAETLGRLGGEADDMVLLAAALAARAPRHGHVCIELAHVAGRIAAEGEALDSEGGGVHGGGRSTAVHDAKLAERIAELEWPSPDAWRRALIDSPIVSVANDDGADTPATDDRFSTGARPLVLDRDRLYLDRYWRYQRRLADAIRVRASGLRDDFRPEDAGRMLSALFPAAASALDRQKLAAALAVLGDLTVISGGPGTGKTTTVARLLALLVSCVAPPGDSHERIRVALAAPTGKAAVRLEEAVHEAVPDLPVDDDVRHVLQRLEAQTLHRLLGWRPDNQTRFRHNADHPLPYDLIVVDEASMVSLALMSKLVDAVPPEARLVLVGDRDQLASVEAGAVLGDICGPTRPAPEEPIALSRSVLDALSPWFGPELAAATSASDVEGMRDRIVHLARFYRFGTDSGIGAVARAIQQGEGSVDRVVAYLKGEATEATTAGGPDTQGQQDRPYDDVAFVDLSNGDLDRDLIRTIAEGFEPAVRAALTNVPASEVLDALRAQRVLCAVRRGPHGVYALNERIERALLAEVPDFALYGTWYVGRPVMVTQNDYGVRLFNGDVGVVVRHPEDRTRVVVAFADPDEPDGVRYLSPARLPPCETVFATSIHKSQGAQFDTVYVVLPAVGSRILSRELIYTGVTRAREHVTVVAPEAVLREALERPVQRASGLEDALWG